MSDITTDCINGLKNIILDEVDALKKGHTLMIKKLNDKGTQIDVMVLDDKGKDITDDQILNLGGYPDGLDKSSIVDAKSR